MMMNQNFALQIYYWYYMREKYNRIVFDKRDKSDWFNDFQTCGTDNSGSMQCRIKINNQIINVEVDRSSLIVDGKTSIRLSVWEYKRLTDDDTERLERKIKRWTMNHASEFEYWMFDLTPGWITVNRVIPMKELNNKSICKSVKYINDVFNEVVQIYTNLVIRG